MTVKQRRYPKEELARRGDEIYERDIKSLVEPGHNGKILVIDVETGDWEMDDDEIAASKRLQARQPDAQVWMLRVGSPYVRRFGAGRIRKTR